jgi:hypothetical protein
MTQQKLNYRQITTAIFIIFFAGTGVGSAFLSVDYFTVYDTMNRFSASGIQVTALYKADLPEDARLITVVLEVSNPGSRPFYFFEYGILLYLNGRQIAHRDTYPQVWMNPGDNMTLVIDLTITGYWAEQVIDAENSNEWNWYVLHPVRIVVVWLSGTLAFLGTSWQGIDEV